MKISKVLLLSSIFLLLPALSLAAYGDVSTYMSSIYAGDGGSPKDAYLDFAEDLAYDSDGNIYIADTYNNVIRRINTSNKISTLAGSGSYGDKTGSNSSAEFALPKGVAVSGDTIFVADTYNHKIKKISGGKVTTLVSEDLSYPEGIYVDGSTLYIADTGNDKIKKVSTSGGTVATIASSISSPKKLITDSDGSNLYVAEGGSYKIIKVNISNGLVSIVAGSGSAGYNDGTGISAQFRNVEGVALDTESNSLYVTDGDGYSDYVRKINLSNNAVTTFATDAEMSSINYPKGIVFQGDYIYVANSGIGTIQKFNKDDGENSTKVAGKNRFNHEFGLQTNSLIGRPNDLVMTADGQYIYLAENNFIRKIKVSDGSTSQVIGSVIDAYRAGDDHRVRFSNITSITIDSGGNNLYVADRWNNRIRKINLSNTEASLVAGGGETDCHKSCNGYTEGT